MTATAHHGAEAELGLLGAIMTSGGSGYLTACESLSEADFLDVRAQAVWRVMGRLDEEARPHDTESVLRALRDSEDGREVGNAALFIASCVEQAISVEVHAAEIAEASRRRRVVAAGGIMASKGRVASIPVDEVIAEAEAVLMGEDLRSLEFCDARRGVQLMTDDLQRRFEAKGQIQGIPTGLDRLDQMLDGLQYGEQTVLAARPSMGKTAIGINIVEHACLERGIPTLVVTLEMTTAALMRRMASSACGITMGEMRRGSFTESDFRKLTVFGAKASKAPLWFLDGISGLTATQMCAGIRRYVRKHGVKLVVIDYLQKVAPAEKHEKRTYEVGAVSKALKACAAKTGAAFLTLAQLNRESEKDKERTPRLSDLADSGQIERDADTVVLIHRVRGDESVQPKLIVAKQRDGSVGVVPVQFDGQFCRFSNQTQSTQQSYADQE